MLRLAVPLSVILASSAAIALARQAAPQPIIVSRTPEPRTPASAEEARGLANQLADMLENDYLSAEIGVRYAAMLRRNAAAGAYDKIGDPVDLGDKMTADLQTVSPDAHLSVFLRGYGPAMKAQLKSQADAKADNSPPPRPDPVGETTWVAPGVAYMAIHFMPQHDAVLTQVRRFMEEHQDAKAAILDVSQCTGGSIHMTDEIFPYLYRKPTMLVRMDARISKNAAPGPGQPASVVKRKSAAGVSRSDQVVTPHPTKKGLFDAKVYVLTSKNTISACEHLAFALHETGRATLVGETTAGAGNYGTFRPFAKRFMTFIPMGRTYNPKTGKGWEGSGIIPDVQVPPRQALAEAIRLANGGKIT